MTVVIAINYGAFGGPAPSEIRIFSDTLVSTPNGPAQSGLMKLSLWGTSEERVGVVGFAGNIKLISDLLSEVRASLNQTQDTDWVDQFCDAVVDIRNSASFASRVPPNSTCTFLIVSFVCSPQFTTLSIAADGSSKRTTSNKYAIIGSGRIHDKLVQKLTFDGYFSEPDKRDVLHQFVINLFKDAGPDSVGGSFIEWKATEGQKVLQDTVYPMRAGAVFQTLGGNGFQLIAGNEIETIYNIRSVASGGFASIDEAREG